ncbi:MAG: c-type cytochrome [Rhodobacteraceae bacterium]|nr:c-type cytochrome [Paracoccaceae bacterium]
MRLTLPIALSLSVLAAAASSQSIGDLTAGEKVFKNCAGCHQVGDTARNGVGPVLSDVVGRVAGTYTDFRYGSDMIAAGVAGLVWTPDQMFEYLENPRDFLRAFLNNDRARAKMSFRLRREQDRLDVIAYLASFEIAALSSNICVTNNSDESYFFAVDDGGTASNSRVTAQLAPGESLCNAAKNPTGGFVSVFENAQALEGCSRLVNAGESDDLVSYAEFDRCRWVSHSG